MKSYGVSCSGSNVMLPAKGRKTRLMWYNHIQTLIILIINNFQRMIENNDFCFETEDKNTTGWAEKNAT